MRAWFMHKKYAGSGPARTLTDRRIAYFLCVHTCLFRKVRLSFNRSWGIRIFLCHKMICTNPTERTKGCACRLSPFCLHLHLSDRRCGPSGISVGTTCADDAAGPLVVLLVGELGRRFVCTGHAPPHLHPPVSHPVQLKHTCSPHSSPKIQMRLAYLAYLAYSR